MTSAPLVHWDDVVGRQVAVGPLAGVWRDLGHAVGSLATGVRHIQVDAGRRSTPVHTHEGEEEVFFILSGAGTSWQDGKTFAVGAGDCVVHPAGGPAHTLVAGGRRLDVLAYGTRRPSALVRLPRAGIAWDGATWVATAPGGHPWEREAAAGELPAAPPAPRPSTIVNLMAVDPVMQEHGDSRFRERDLGRAAGSIATGLRHVEVDAGMLGYPPHAHSAEEEIFVVLDGGGSLLLYDCRLPEAAPREEPLRPGHVAAFPAGTGVAHAIRAGEGGITYLAYGERVAHDAAFFPRSGKISLRAFGFVTRLPRLDYWDERPSGD